MLIERDACGDDGTDRRVWLTMAAELAAMLSLVVAI
jgi:hypothetical protein